MARTCSICIHPKKAAINKAIANGTSYRDIAGQYGVSKTAVGKHKKGCIPTQVERVREVVEIKSIQDFLDKLDNNLKETEAILREAQDGYEEKDAEGKPVKVKKKPLTALKAVDVHNKTLAMYLQLFKEVRDQEDHDLKKMKEEQAMVLKIVMEEVSVYPELAEKIVKRLGGRSD